MVRLLDEPTGGPTGFAASPASSIGGAGPPSPVGTPQSRPGSGQRPYRSAGLARLPPEDPGIAMLGFGMPTQAAARPVSASSIGSGGESGRKASLARLPDDVLQLQLQGQPQLLPQASSPLLPIGRGSGDAGRSAVVGLGGPTSASSSSAAPGIETAKKSGLSAMRDRLGKGLSVSTGTAEPQIKSQVFRLLTNGETITNYYEFAEEIYSGGAKGKVLVAKRKSNGEEVIVKIRTKQTNRGGERGWRAIMSQVCSMKGSIHVLDITEILEEALRYASFLQVVPERVSMAEQIVHTTRRWAVFALVLPMVTAFLVAIAVSFDVLVAQMRARRRAQRCLCCGISFAPLCVAGVALCAAGELSLGILGSSMCADADAIVLRGASAAFGNKSAMLNFTTFYTAGLGKNPATAQLESIEAGILTVIVVMRKIKQKALKSCPG